MNESWVVKLNLDHDFPISDFETRMETHLPQLQKSEKMFNDAMEVYKDCLSSPVSQTSTIFSVNVMEYFIEPMAPSAYFKKESLDE